MGFGVVFRGLEKSDFLSFHYEIVRKLFEEKSTMR